MPPQDTPVRPPELRGDWYSTAPKAGRFDLLLSWPGKSADRRFDVHYWTSYEMRFAEPPVAAPIQAIAAGEFPAALSIAAGDASSDAVYVLVAIHDTAFDVWWYVEIAANLAEQRAYAEVAYDAFGALKIRQPMVGGRIGFQKKALIGSQSEIAPSACELLVESVNEHTPRSLTVWFETEVPQTWRVRSTALASVRGGSPLSANAGVQARTSQFAKLPASFAGDATAYLYVDVEAIDSWSRVVHWRYISEAMPLAKVTKASPFVFEHEKGRFTRVVSASLLAPT